MEKTVKTTLEKAAETTVLMENLRFTTTQMNRVLLITPESYCYVRHRQAVDNRTEYWRCELKKTCPGRGVSTDNRSQFRQSKEHNHLPDPLRNEMRAIKNKIKELAATGIADCTTADILDAVLLTASDAAKARLPSVNHLKRTIQRSRNKNQVALTLPSEDYLNMPLEFQVIGSISQLEQFLLWDSGHTIAEEERILMFGSQKNLIYLQSCTAILMDGTCKTIPHQLYTIHGSRLEDSSHKPGKALPLIFLLLLNKTEGTFQKAFNQLSVLLPEWEPDRIMLDFEQTAINSARVQWPNSQISCSFFHLSQTIYKTIGDLGLASFYGENVEFATKLKMICALAFVPVDEVINSWEELLEILQPWALQQAQEVREKIDDFLMYFELNYIGKSIGGVRREPRTAPIQFWNVRMQTMEHYVRNDNEVEKFHMKISQTTGEQLPNLGKFFKGLQNLQLETEKFIEDMSNGAKKRRPRPQYARLAESTTKITENWPQRLSLEAYLREITHNIV